MNGFERQYYEAEVFWEGDAVGDDNNISRIKETAALIPASVTSLADIGCGNGVFVNYLHAQHPSAAARVCARAAVASG